MAISWEKKLLAFISKADITSNFILNIWKFENDKFKKIYQKSFIWEEKEEMNIEKLIICRSQILLLLKNGTIFKCISET